MKLKKAGLYDRPFYFEDVASGFIQRKIQNYSL